MGPDSNIMLKPGFKKSIYIKSDLVFYGNKIYACNWTTEINLIWTDLKYKVKDERDHDHWPLAINKVEQLNCHILGQERIKSYPISTANMIINWPKVVYTVGSSKM